MEALSKSATFTANLDSLSPIRDYQIKIGEASGLGKDRIYKLCLAVDEIATNIINYGYVRSEISDGKIDMTVLIENNSLKIILEDYAIPFNPLEYAVPGENDLNIPLESRPIGGLGIMLAKENVDQFSYSYYNGRNRNTFCMNLLEVEN
jgi:anti-sigma regulatory factor (Ser/Thr protein kinase)